MEYNNKKFLIFKKRRKKTILRNIQKEDIKRYIDKIIYLNKNIEIYKIYYNEIDKTLLIIANKRIQIQRIINKNIISFKALNDIQTEIYRLKSQDTILDEKYISLSNIKSLYSNILNQLYNIFLNIEKDIQLIISSMYGENADIVIYNYNSSNNTIKLGFTNDYKHRKYKPFTITLINDKISCIKSETKENNNILNILDKQFNTLFNYYKKINELNKEYTNNIRSINANLYISITLYSITITSKYSDTIEFKIKYSTYENKYYIKCNDIEIESYLKQIAPSLLELIYISIIECPEWSQEKLYSIRDKELNKPNIKRYSKK